MFNWLLKALMAVQKSNSKIADLMNRDPNGWNSDDKYYAVYKNSNLRVWVSNKDYGLHVEFDKTRWKPSSAERKIIWSAWQNIIESRRQAKERKIQRMIDQYMDKLEE